MPFSNDQVESCEYLAYVAWALVSGDDVPAWRPFRVLGRDKTNNLPFLQSFDVCKSV